MAQDEEELTFWFKYRFRELFTEVSEVRVNREQAIRERAYALWEQEGHLEGRALEYWLRAEAEFVKAADAHMTNERRLARPSPTRGQQASTSKPRKSNRRSLA